MDDFEGRAGPAAGHRRIAELRQVGARSPLPDRQLHAGGVARRRSIQEGDPDRQPELLAADPGRGGRTRNAGKPAQSQLFVELPIVHCPERTNRFFSFLRLPCAFSKTTNN